VPDDVEDDDGIDDEVLDEGDDGVLDMVESLLLGVVVPGVVLCIVVLGLVVVVVVVLGVIVLCVIGAEAGSTGGVGVVLVACA
jgi:hypothetical protein